MTTDNFILLCIFAATMTFTPGPANLLLLGTSLQSGVRRTLPMLAGVVSGFLFIGIAITFGLGEVFIRQPDVLQMIRVAGSIYLIYLAIRLFGLRHGQIEGKPRHNPGFFSGFMIHPLSPKAWLMLVSGYSQFVQPDQQLAGQATIILMVFALTGMLANLLWTVSGGALQGIMQSPRINYSVFSGLSASLLMLIFMMWL